MLILCGIRDVICADALDVLPRACPDPAVIVMDPPYGTGRHGYQSGGMRRGTNIWHHIPGDQDTALRDAILARYPGVPAIVFGALHRNPPAGTVQTLVYRKPPNAGAVSARAGFRRDVEGIHLVGRWPIGAPVQSSVLTTAAPSAGNPWGLSAKAGHPMAKPLDVLRSLLAVAPRGLVLDPCCGSGSVAIACEQLGRECVSIEIDRDYAERAATRPVPTEWRETA